jgi:hypothetical protein
MPHIGLGNSQIQQTGQSTFTLNTAKDLPAGQEDKLLPKYLGHFQIRLAKAMRRRTAV